MHFQLPTLYPLRTIWGDCLCRACKGNGLEAVLPTSAHHPPPGFMREGKKFKWKPLRIYVGGERVLIRSIIVTRNPFVDLAIQRKGQ